MTTVFNLNISEKFEKELVTFTLWISESDYKIKKRSEQLGELEWSTDLLTSFDEPGRNKLECYIKELKKEYFITYKDKEIDDIKMITKTFRENKSKVKVNPSKNKKDRSENDNMNNTTKSTDNTTKSTDNTTKSTDNTTKNKNVVKLDMDTEILVDILGMPKYCKNEYIKYKWDITFKNTSYVIYNWVNKDGSFDTFEKTSWYIMTENKIEDVSNMLHMLKKDNHTITLESIDGMNPYKQEIKSISKQKEELKEQLKQNEDIEEQLKQREDIEEQLKQREDIEEFENLEIDLDDIEF